ncbi:MAG: energy transducer TonB, partial [Mizugakiibacter sp.]|uniref:energy transducer TonB n=1 Tax=Mizugakiibacter sp. TaxID=1972610 RepID=UPI00320E85C0
MTARHSASASRRARGVAAPAIIAVIVVLAILLAAYFFYFRPRQAAAPTAAEGPAQAAQQAAGTAVPPSVANLSVGDLLKEARKAMHEQRLLAPAGNNAFEFYLNVLQKEPNNPVAQDALRETFPFATSVAEQEINQRNFAEAQREIDLLSKADPNNYTLTILRSKLDAQRKLADREQEQQQRQQLAEQQAAQQKQAAATTPAAPAPAQASAQQSAAAAPAPAAPAPARPAAPAPQ